MTIKELFAPSDMTTGTPWKKIVLFTVPMLLGNIAQQLYSTVDSIIVGRYVGDNALAAVGSAAPIYNLLLVLFMGVSAGASVMVAQYFGAKDREGLSKSIGNAIVLTALASLIIMGVGAVTIRPLLNMLGTPESIIDWCYSYLMVLIMGIAGTSYYFIFTGILRGMGDSVSALVYLLVATVMNIALDIWFVAGLGLGVFGVALATIIAQITSAILSFIKLMKMRQVFDMKLKCMKLEKEYAGTTLKLGLPSGLTQMIFSAAMIVVQSLTNSFGETVIAANVIIMRVDGFVMLPNFSFGMALTTFAGQNVGAKQLDRVSQGAKQGTLLALVTSFVITGLVVLFGHNIMGLFTTTEELIDLARRMMLILALGYVLMAVTQCLSGVMRGAGDTMTPMWISLITTVVVRVPIAYGIAYLTRTPEQPNGSYYCLFISLLISWVVGGLITFIAYQRGGWKKKAVIS